MLLGKQLIGAADPLTFDTAQLINGTALWRGLSEPGREHPPHDAQTSGRIESQFGLPQQAIGTGTAGLAGRIEAHAPFADPSDERARLGRQGDGRMEAAE